MTSLNQQVAMFKALGDPVRLRIISLLTEYDELCVCHLIDALEIPQRTISRHLSVLRHAELVHARRDGKWMYYCLSPQAGSPAGLLQQSPNEQFKQDVKALQSAL